MKLDSSTTVGSKVDIRDENHDWNVGEVVRTVKFGGVDHFVVRYRDAIKQYEEMLPTDDLRLAPYRSHRHSNFFFESSNHGLMSLFGRMAMPRLRAGTDNNFLYFRSNNIEESQEF